MSNAADPVRTPLPPPNGMVRPSHGAGLLRPPWQKGVSPNPGGLGGEYHETVSLARQASPDAMRKLIAKMDSDDERVGLIAAQAVLERAWGKPKEMDPKDFERGRMVLDLNKLSPEEIDLLLKITRSGAVRPADPEQQPSDAQYDAQSSSDDAAAPHGTIDGTATAVEEPPLSFVRSKPRETDRIT